MQSVSSLLHSPHESEREKGEPTPADDDGETLKKTNRRSLKHSRLVKVRRYNHSHGEHNKQDASGDGGGCPPTLPIRIAHEARDERKNGGSERTEGDVSTDAMNSTMKGMG